MTVIVNQKLIENKMQWLRNNTNFYLKKFWFNKNNEIFNLYESKRTGYKIQIVFDPNTSEAVRMIL